MFVIHYNHISIITVICPKIQVFSSSPTQISNSTSRGKFLELEPTLTVFA